MRIAICDDDKAELEKVTKTVERFDLFRQSNHEITVQTFTTGDDILRAITKHGSFDLLLLDIVMPGMNGIELAEEIRRSNSNCKIIFLTCSPEFAVCSYKVAAFYYLLKPFDEAELTSLLNRALDEMAQEQSASIVVKGHSKLTRIQIYTIQHVEIVRHNILFHLRNHEVLSSYGSLTEFQDVLLSDKRFIQCHRSFIVNMNAVISISNKDFILEDKTLVPISKQEYPQVKNAYINYFFNKRNGL